MAVKTLEQLEAELASVQSAIQACLDTGQKYALPGGRSSERVSLEVLERREARLEKRIARLDGSAASGGVVRINTSGRATS